MLRFVPKNTSSNKFALEPVKQPAIITMTKKKSISLIQKSEEIKVSQFFLKKNDQNKTTILENKEE